MKVGKYDQPCPILSKSTNKCTMEIWADNAHLTLVSLRTLILISESLWTLDILHKTTFDY